LLKFVSFKISGTAFWGNKIKYFSTVAAMKLLIFGFFYRWRTAFRTAYFNVRRFSSSSGLGWNRFVIKDYDKS